MPGQKRLYRDQCAEEGFRVKAGQTDLFISAPLHLKPLVTRTVVELRHQLERYMKRHKGFAESLAPLDPLPGAPGIVEKMCYAAAIARVGPMAAVAGTIAQMVGERLSVEVSEGAVENGGDLFLWGEGNRRVGIFSGDSPLSTKVAMEVDLHGEIGICTSSGKIGHSLSLGNAYGVTVVADEAAVADAWATAMANMAKDERSIGPIIGMAKQEPTIKGVVAIIGEKIGAWGKVRLTKW